jgi:hypothetical protein
VPLRGHHGEQFSQRPARDSAALKRGDQGIRRVLASKATRGPVIGKSVDHEAAPVTEVFDDGNRGGFGVPQVGGDHVVGAEWRQRVFPYAHKPPSSGVKNLRLADIPVSGVPSLVVTVAVPEAAVDVKGDPFGRDHEVGFPPHLAPHLTWSPFQVSDRHQCGELGPDLDRDTGPAGWSTR